MIWNIIFIIIGLAGVLWGADRFTDGACGLARRWKVSELVIGLTIVALGTSLPEFVVSFISCLRGSGDMSVGNIIGSNTFNSLVIVGASCMLLVIPVERGVLWRDLPFCILVTAAFVLMVLTGEINRYSAAILCLLFAVFLTYNIYIAKRQRGAASEVVEEQTPLWRLLGLIVLGMAVLVGCGQLLVNSATDVARALGVSEKVIGITILAAGTSLPELATSLVAARKGSDGLALGNVIGSNVFNIAFVLGICNMVSPMQMTDVNLVDLLAVLGSVVLLWLVCLTGRRLTRWEGVLLLLAYGAYLFWVLFH
ncbi:MAG: calcium/sodium antiporter [Bacteroidaceae bacterium]|nr:calcium/sodium antiporter [Bacteroidaceae bacterium]